MGGRRMKCPKCGSNDRVGDLDGRLFCFSCGSFLDNKITKLIVKYLKEIL
jgi:transcription initiation factor TFIIIB Brf1 subunit/transcription initiation factor TFIIB